MDDMLEVSRTYYFYST